MVTLAQLQAEVAERFGGMPADLRFAQGGRLITSETPIDVSPPVPAHQDHDAVRSKCIFLKDAGLGQADAPIDFVYGLSGGLSAGIVTKVPDALRFHCLCEKCGVQVSGGVTAVGVTRSGGGVTVLRWFGCRTSPTS
jgi:hypothetical protein